MKILDHVLLLLVDSANIPPATTISFITFIGGVSRPPPADARSEIRSKQVSNRPHINRFFCHRISGHYGAHPGRHTTRLRESEVLDFLIAQRQERDLEDSTLNQAICALRCFFRDHLGRDWEGWNKMRREEQLPNIISRVEVDRLLAGTHQGRFRAVFTLMYHCGLRLSEATHLKPGHIDSSRGVLRVVHANSKSNKDREVPVSPELIARLRNFWKQHRNPQWLFPAPGRGWKGGGTTLATAMGRSTKPMSTSSVQAAMRATVLSLGWDKRRGYRPVTCHTLRHCFATHLLDAGVSVRLVSEYLGHASLKPTLVYLHLTEVSESKAREVLARFPGL